jgi:hypothetical protein
MALADSGGAAKVVDKAASINRRFTTAVQAINVVPLSFELRSEAGPGGQENRSECVSLLRDCQLVVCKLKRKFLQSGETSRKRAGRKRCGTCGHSTIRARIDPSLG